jgi:branched-chain amino acid aminotransferase
LTGFGDAQPLVHHNGALVPAAEAALPVSSMAVRYGLVAFEGVRAYRGHDGALHPWLLAGHLARLDESCAAIGLDLDLDLVPAAIEEVIRANSLTRDCYLLITVSAASPIDVRRPYPVVLTVAVVSTGHRKWLASGEGMAMAIRDLVSPPDRLGANPTRTLSTYARRRLALAEVEAQGYDDAALLNRHGRVTGATSATIFLLEKDLLITPPREDAGVSGIMRSWIIETAPKLGVGVRAEPVTAQRLREATEVFVCGTGVEFGSVRTIDDIQVPGWPRCTTATLLTEELFTQARAA